MEDIRAQLAKKRKKPKKAAAKAKKAKAAKAATPEELDKEAINEKRVADMLITVARWHKHYAHFNE
jgi:hypothetical protein